MYRRLAWACVFGLLGCSAGSTGESPGTVDGGPTSPGTNDASTSARDGATPQGADAGPGTDAALPPDATSPGLDASSGSGDGGDDDGGAAGYGPYGAAGPESVTTATLQVPAPNGTFTVTAYLPGSMKPHPAVILSSGFFQDGVAYAPYANRLASWGIVTFTRDDSPTETAPNIAEDVAYMVTTWLAATDTEAGTPIYGQIDTTKLGLAGHSKGGQVALLAGEGGAHGLVQGVFGLDPVDTSVSGSAEARTTLSTIGVPIAFIGETTDMASTSCAPAADNYEVLYQAAASPAVAITAIGADHTMFEDPANCFACSVCTAGAANAAQVLAEAVRYLTAFFARQLLGDSSVGAAFSGAGAPADVAGGFVTLESK